MSHGFRFIGNAIEEFLTGVPSRDITPEQFDHLEPDAQQTLTTHVETAPHPIFEKADVNSEGEPQQAAPEPAPAEAAPEPVVDEPTADESGRIAPG